MNQSKELSNRELNEQEQEKIKEILVKIKLIKKLMKIKQK